MLQKKKKRLISRVLLYYLFLLTLVTGFWQILPDWGQSEWLRTILQFHDMVLKPLTFTDEPHGNVGQRPLAAAAPMAADIHVLPSPDF